ETDENDHTATDNYYHRINFNIRNMPDSMQNIIATGGITLNYGNSTGNAFTANYTSDSLTNDLTSATYSRSHSVKGNTDVSYIHKTQGKWKFVKTSLSLSANSTLSDAQWNNLTQYFDAGTQISDDEFQNGNNFLGDYSLSFLGMHTIKNNYYY